MELNQDYEVYYSESFAAAINGRSEWTFEADENLTGYPSIDKPWLKYYADGAYEKSINPPRNKSIWDVYNNILDGYDTNIPVIKYFNHSYTAKKYKSLIVRWAKAFKAMGIEPDEMVPVYGTWSPDISAMFFALNAIGAYPYFEKLDITKDALNAETKGAKVAVVHSSLWGETVRDVFSEERFQKVIVSNLYDDVKGVLKVILKIKTDAETLKSGLTIPKNSKYIMAKKALAKGKKYTGDIEAVFRPGRIASVTSSSGTTSAAVKGIMDSNESILANLWSTYYSNPNYETGNNCLLSFPPTASTAFNCLFLLPILFKMTIVMDPRLSPDNYYKQIKKYKPSVTIMTGAIMEGMFRKIEEDLDKGKKIDLRNAKSFIIGGSGTTKEKRNFMNDVLKRCGSETDMVIGYGSSEIFGVASVEKWDKERPESVNSKNVTDVGIPTVGFVISAFDEAGNELTYNTRGELRIKSDAVMEGYFGKPELTAAAIENGWFKTGDVGEVDENGSVYIYGRMKDTIEVGDRLVYLFDIANDFRVEFNLDDCMAEKKQLDDGKTSVVIYLVQKQEQYVHMQKLIPEMDSFIRKKYQIIVDGYKEFKTTFPISPTTCKPLTRQMEGFVTIDADEKIYDVSYAATDEQDVLTMYKQLRNDQPRKNVKESILPLKSWRKK